MSKANRNRVERLLHSDVPNIFPLAFLLDFDSGLVVVIPFYWGFGVLLVGGSGTLVLLN